ncbi:MAG: sulfite exporter TauE/SafE family protein [Syntrophobacteraceae bacterium]|nr:sulfite exporter TauE/SafE family protein [Desulfobacteraceae bacterium]
MSPMEFVLVGLAAVVGGAVNAIAGGGTLITFPMLTAVGIPAVAANVTNTVALCPGYLGGTFAQMKDLRGQEKRIWLLAPTGVLFGILGGLLLLKTGEQLFRTLVPYLILLASGLLAVQDPMRAWILRRAGASESGVPHEGWTVLPVGIASIYGGYFGAGLSVIVLAVLGLVIEDSLTRLNAVKQVVAFCVNIAAAVFFLFSGHVVWMAALVMAVGALLGGVIGGRLAGRIKPAVLRLIVVTIGIVVAVIYFLK